MTYIKFNINKSIEKEFDRIAQKLFNETELIVNTKEYLLTEIEFYVYNEAHHPDPFVHRNEKQQTNNKWYFHGSGIDITIGDKNTYGGILLRGLKEVSDVDGTIYHNGPLNILREIFSQINLRASVQNFGLAERKENGNSEIYKSTRIGLNPKGKEKGTFYVNKNYRYLVDITKVAHKYKEKEKVKKADNAILK